MTKRNNNCNIESEKDEIGYLGMAYPNALTYFQNGQVSDEACYGYEFINLSNVPVIVNGVFLDRYFSGSRATPTIIAGSFNVWSPKINAGERDTSLYQFTFNDSFYSTGNPYHQLIVCKKLLTPLTVNRK